LCQSGMGSISMQQRSVHRPIMPPQGPSSAAEFRRPSSAGVRHSLPGSGAVVAAAVRLDVGAAGSGLSRSCSMSPDVASTAGHGQGGMNVLHGFSNGSSLKLAASPRVGVVPAGDVARGAAAGGAASSNVDGGMATVEARPASAGGGVSERSWSGSNVLGSLRAQPGLPTSHLVLQPMSLSLQALDGPGEGETSSEQHTSWPAWPEGCWMSDKHCDCHGEEHVYMHKRLLNCKRIAARS
jgi:hypothetical protein